MRSSYSIIALTALIMLAGLKTEAVNVDRALTSAKVPKQATVTKASNEANVAKAKASKDPKVAKAKASKDAKVVPSVTPTSVPSNVPSVIPLTPPTNDPSNNPSLPPSNVPSVIPLTPPTNGPSNNPSLPPSRLAWLQIGEDIDGENENDYSGYSVSLSDDGRSVAIGSYNNDDNGSNAGQCRVYSYDSDEGKWLKKGGVLNGEGVGDRSGISVSISDDGNTVAVGAPYNDGNGSDSGHVRVHKYDNELMAWSQLGQDIDGLAAGDQSGGSVRLTGNGKSVVIGAYNYEFGRGRVLTYKFDDVASEWVSFGGEIKSENSGDLFGYCVSMSKHGAVVAIGAPYNDSNGSYSGSVDIYLYNEGENAWKRMGTSIVGDGGDFSGWSVSLSDDGEAVAIGSPYYNDNTGRTQMYVYESSQSDWVQMGDDIVGEAAGDYSGRSVSLSADGTMVAIGAEENDGNGSDSGHVRMFEYDGSEWSQIGDDIDGESARDWSGWFVSLAGDGLTVAIGAILNDGDGGNDSGHVRMYKYAPE